MRNLDIRFRFKVRKKSMSSVRLTWLCSAPRVDNDGTHEVASFFIRLHQNKINQNDILRSVGRVIRPGRVYAGGWAGPVFDCLCPCHTLHPSTWLLAFAGSDDYHGMVGLRSAYGDSFHAFIVSWLFVIQTWIFHCYVLRLLTSELLKPLRDKRFPRYASWYISVLQKRRILRQEGISG